MNLDRFFKEDRRGVTPLTAALGLLYAFLTFYCSRSHEPWFDEVYPWITAQSASWSYLIFEHPHWDAHPVLWHSILKIGSFLFPENGLPLLGLLFAWIFAAIILYFSNLPIYFRFGFVFSYFFFYQYPIVVRGYVLYPILFWLIFNLWEKRENKPYYYGAILSLTASVTIHGIILIVALLGVEFIQGLKRGNLFFKERNRSIPYLIAGFTCAFWMMNLIPHYSPVPTSLSLEEGIHRLYWICTIFTPIKWLTIVIFIGSSYLMFKRGILSLFLLPITLWILFFFFIYYSPWHEGILFSWWAMCVMKSLTIIQNWNLIQKKIVVFLFCIIFLIQIKWSAVAFWNDILYPYSAGKELAKEIKQNGWEKDSFIGFSEHASAVNYYFNKNLFQNSWKPENRYYSLNKSVDLARPLDGIIQGTPRFIIANEIDEGISPIQYKGYILLKRYKGSLFWKDTVTFPNGLDLYIRE